MDNYELELERIKKLQQEQLTQELDKRKNQDLSTIDREEAVAKTEYTNQRNNKNTASQIRKLNYAEFMNNRGQSSFGISNQAELSRQNMLARDIGNIDNSENSFAKDMSSKRIDVNTGYNTDIASGKTAIETDIASKLLDYKERLRQEEEQRKADALAHQRSLSLKSVGNLGNYFDDDEEVNPLTQQGQNSFADSYIEQMISSAKRTGLKYNAMAVGQELADLKSQGKITQQEYQAMIVELQNQGLIG